MDQCQLPGEVLTDAAPSYVGRRRYVEYIPGELPIIVSAPHGGEVAPVEIPDRAAGVTGQDTETQALTCAASDALLERTGQRPHVVLCHLSRTKLDANRSIDHSAPPSRAARRAWHEYHAFIEQAKDAVVARYGRGLYVDVHGHAHDGQRVELGYMLRGDDLALTDAELNQPAHVRRSSLRALAEATPERFAAMLRGPDSLGDLLERRGIAAVPSPSQPVPGDPLYFNGGYNVRHHGSRDGGTISGVQIEANWVGVRDSAESRERFGRALAEAVEVFLRVYAGVTLPSR